MKGEWERRTGITCAEVCGSGGLFDCVALFGGLGVEVLLGLSGDGEGVGIGVGHFGEMFLFVLDGTTGLGEECFGEENE